VQCTKISPEFKFGVKGQGHQGQKNEKVWHYFRERSLGRELSSLSSTPVGKSMHAV